MTETAPLARHFAALEQTHFQRLEHAASLKGLLKPFTGKGSLEDWARRCMALRDGLTALGLQRVLPQARAYPLSRLDVQLAQQATGAGTIFLRWRNRERSAMGTALWQAAVLSPATPDRLIADLYAIELQRVVLNMQISLTHSIARQALDCAHKMAQADAIYRRRADRHAASSAVITQESP